MKRRNILKFVSLLSAGSFVMLAAASCTQPNNTNQNPNSGSTPTTPTDPSQELAAAKTALSLLLDTKNQNIQMYVDYAKIQDTLIKAYDTAKDVLDDTASTTQNLKDATTVLESAISTAEKAKTDFDTKNSALVTAYNSLKESLKVEDTILASVEEANYSAIKENLVALYSQAKAIVKTTLDPITGNIPQAKSVMDISQPLANAIMRNNAWKQNADNLVNSFIKQTLVKKDLTGVSQTAEQPGNYSFVGYSVDVDNANWSFAKRQVWSSLVDHLAPAVADDENKPVTPLTDVSWIYSLAGDNAKYTLNFRYFGAQQQTAYLYFPYKLVKTGDSSTVGLQYSLNGGEAQQISFAESSGAGASDDSGGESQAMPSSAHMNSTPTVDDIKVAKIALSNLKFNSNTVEFSVPSGKVAPMIGNMYITSSDKVENKDKIYSDMFGNTYNKETDPTAVTVDLLKGYSLATSYNIFVQQFKNLMQDNNQISKPVYLVGFIGGAQTRFQNKMISEFTNSKDNPNKNDGERTFTIYVNAPQAGNYYISGSYITTQREPRSVRFEAKDKSTNSVAITVMSDTNFETLKTFDTSSTLTTVISQNSNKTLNLQKGLNKIVITSVDGKDTPFIGNLTFTLMGEAANPSANNGN
ncbi:FIVAR domain-containing protein [Mycoplasma tullyi]|uniref:FIVAR domain-containing protein n=1 Tax=Mycoplasma tullyi TaxID=1612150 RepID=A0A7D7U473_9MOLU|nr:FIVAR domain-containing protein [Mycoplasma tullyi]QMT98432.1 FIVAR domain-containing protein [Mycoplasma tullyi]